MEVPLRRELPVWVICVAAHKTRSAAEADARKLRQAGKAGHVFNLPDYPETTSGKDFWITYVGPYEYEPGSTTSIRAALRAIQRTQKDRFGNTYKDAYALKLDDHGKREEIRKP